MQTVEDIIERYNKGEKLKYLFFWGHTAQKDYVGKQCLSQWYPAEFIEDDIIYPTAEHYMMAEKARLFKDTEILKEILEAKHPKQAKELGRKVKNFNPEVWDKHCCDIVYRGNLLKFSQNLELRSFLVNTNSRILAEASPYDKIWGIGMDEKSPGIENPTNWRGTNYLGFALMEVRKELSGGNLI